MKNLLLATVVLCVFSLVSCSKDDPIGTGNATLKITAGLTNSSATGKQMTSKSTSSTLNQNLSFTSGYVWVSEIVFYGTLESGNFVNRKVQRFSKIDFETGIATPSLDDVTIPAGTYTDVYLGVELRDEDSQPSVIMEGTYTHSNSTVIPIRFEFNSGEVFEAETLQQVVVNENETAISKIVFDPQVWFSVVSTNALDNASLTDGVIIISGTKNQNIFDLVADRLDVSTESVFQ